MCVSSNRIKFHSIVITYVDGVECLHPMLLDFFCVIPIPTSCTSPNSFTLLLIYASSLVYSMTHVLNLVIIQYQALTPSFIYEIAASSTGVVNVVVLVNLDFAVDWKALGILLQRKLPY